MVVMEGWVIPADRRGSCCFLLGIVTVTFHGASHAGITKKSSLSVLKNHPVFQGRGFWSRSWKCQSSFSHWLSFFRLNSWIGSSDDKLKNYERIRPAPDAFMSIKDHLPSSLSWQDKKQKQEGRHLETQVFSSLPLEKNPPNLQCCLEGDDSWLRLLRTPKLKNK